MIMSASAFTTDGADHTVELVVLENPKSATDGGLAVPSKEIIPLLSQAERPKINIFKDFRSREKPLNVDRNGKIQYSGLVCMALSSIIYFVMEVLSDKFNAQPIPLFETAFTRCTVTLILSCLWLRISGQPLFEATHPWSPLVLRALLGSLSLLSFVYCIQRIPFSQALVLGFTTPIFASIVAKIVLHEKLKIADVVGLICSFFGMLFIFKMLYTRRLLKAEEASIISFMRNHHIYISLIGLFSSITSGISYCLIKAAAKASDQPVLTVFSFGILASPATGICSFAFEEFVLPSRYSLSLMLILGTLSFVAEVFLARGLQLEKVGKAVNVQFTELSLVGGYSILELELPYHSYGAFVHQE
ncbi:Drug/metabolite transporter [Gossypium australe]|uniref:Drug/metabolite transporter n=1 Tax=Gossypium australe TaxID=47621 RepID=A0A5B6UQX7_9ROSI|nr:Drug/metabolite transporter [Gossypium australe]